MAIPVVPRGTDKAKLVEVIETRSIRGAGTLEDPCRQIIQYWTKTGRLIGEDDPADVVEQEGVVSERQAGFQP